METLPSIDKIETFPENSPYSSYICEKCHLSFKSPSDFQKHIYLQKSSENPSNPAEKSTICKICKKNCATYRGMRQHMGKVHSVTKKIKCKHCNKKFKDNYAVKYHRRQVHEKLTQIQCEKCQKVLYNQYCFRKHEAACPGFPLVEIPEVEQGSN